VVDFVTKMGENADTFNFKQYIELEVPKEGVAQQNNIITSVI
jgi:hypothetical protein